MDILRPCLIALTCGLGSPAAATCASLVASVCPEGPTADSQTARFIQLPPRPPAFAEGEVFPVAEHNILMNPKRYGLPPVDGPWRYYQIDHEVFRVDNATHQVLEVVTEGNRLMIR
jgi:hypothetical protein